ncbi:amino acid ABC transporter substrate-binding protein (PAAT family) [Jatrophihabitans sp. GAS493]|nr:amino acid ABC transporter substrate-binding protein (PAAT family) [Jatrophihabitans sp. GAS493]
MLMRRQLTAVVAVAAAVISLSACASNKETSGPTGASVSATVSANDAAIALLPAKIKTAGKLIVGVNVPYSPNEYKDSSGKIVGFDVDLLDAVAKGLGLTTQYTEADFSKIIPAVQAGTYDVGMSSFTDTKEREQTVDFATYFSAGILWAAPAGKTVDPNNACGLKVAVQTTTTEDTDDVPGKSKACTTAGKPAIIKVQFDSQDDATNAVVLGKVDAMSADSPVTAYAIKQAAGKLTQAGAVFESAPYGWPVAKGSTLAQALQKSLQTLIDDGTYGKICEKWGVQTGEIKTSQINGATS